MALKLSERLLKLIVEWKEVSSRKMWVRLRLSRECWVFLSEYGAGNERSKEELNIF